MCLTLAVASQYYNMKPLILFPALLSLALCKEIPTYSLKTLLNDVRDGTLDDVADTLRRVGAFTVTEVTGKERLDKEMRNLRRDAARCFQVIERGVQLGLRVMVVTLV